ncbi:uncharacterized protein JCM6883_002071 [Sporobolomyces salmoneus]|uniref:uncharacterized protein n=1 Tax=Sporobolomyces salmoneus TaxID=183962 RepID=UPI003181985B
MERTFAVLLASEAKSYQTQAVEAALKEERFGVLAGESISSEELAEVGLLEDDNEQTDENVIWILEREDAVKTLNGLNSQPSLLSTFKLLTAPTASSAEMIIDSLFPSLAAASNPDPISPSLGEPTPTKPFPLSNLALTGELSPSPTSSSRNLPSKIAQALEQLESNHGSPTTPTARRTFEATQEEEATQDEEATQEAPEREGEEADDIAANLEGNPSNASLAESVARPPSSTALSVSTTSATSASSFKARAMPPPPTAQPRLTKSAALRLGVSLPSSTPRASTKRQSISTSERAALDRLTRRQSVPLPPPSSSTAKTVEVRMSKAAMLRMGVPLPATTDKNSSRSRQSSSTSLERTDKPDRRLSISTSLKSLREPTIAPRSTKSSSLRTGTSTDAATKPTARARSQAVAILGDDAVDSGPTPSAHKRRQSVHLQSTRPPAVEVRMSRASMLRNGQTVPASSTSHAKSGVSDVKFDGVPGHKRRESVTVPSLHQAPQHTPRPNRASLLRQKSDSATESPRPASSTSSSQTRTHSRAPSTFSSTPRLNRAAELRQKALQVAAGKEQVPTTVKVEGGRTRELSAKGSGVGSKTPRPASAMSDLSNGSRV